MKEFSGPDPFRREVKLELESVYYPLGFPLQLATNCAEINKAAEESWGHYPQAFGTPPLRLRVVVDPGVAHPPAPVYRGQEHLMTITADANNFAVCDHTRHAAFCWLNAEAARDRPFAAYYFLEAMANYSLTQLYLTPVHGACIARDGRGVLLCGPSGAGKTSLAYHCARNGWTYVSDNESWLVRGGADPLVRGWPPGQPLAAGHKFATQHEKAGQGAGRGPGGPPHQLLLGNPRRIRFRDTARELFPELNSHQPALDANGKMSITTAPADIVTAYQCCVARVVILARQPDGPATVRELPAAQVLDRFLSELPLYDRGIRDEQRASLQRIAELHPVELRYSRLDDALRKLESLLT